MTTPTVDTDRIRQQADLLAIVRADGIRLTEGAGYWWGPCPFCKEGHDRFKVFPRTGNGQKADAFYCRRCSKRGDVIDYIQARDSLSFVEACMKLEPGQVGQDLPKTQPKQALESPLSDHESAEWRYHAELMANKALDYLASSDDPAVMGARQWLEARGIGYQDIVTQGLGYNDQWRQIVPGQRLPPGLTIPRWDHEVKITAINVYLDRDSRERYGTRRMFAGGSSAKSFWNGFRIPEARTVIIVEGELDAVLLSRFLPPLVVATTCGGADCMPDELGVLKGKRVIVALDNDDAGRRGAERWRDRLPEVTVVTVPERKDVTDLWQVGGDGAVTAWARELIDG